MKQAKLQQAFDQHRLKRNAKSKEHILDPGFQGWHFDEILHRVLEAKQGLTKYVDPRNNLSIWSRPPRHIRDLIHDIQQVLAPIAGPCKLYPSSNAGKQADAGLGL